jgi:hypothetical protein
MSSYGCTTTHPNYTCPPRLNPLSDDGILHEICCYLVFLNLLVYILIYGTPKQSNIQTNIAQSTRVIQKVKIQHGWEGKGNHRRPSCSQSRPRSQRFPFVFAFKETSGRPEVSRRRRGEKRSHYVVVCTGGEVL